jgi:hypothetical protein
VVFPLIRLLHQSPPLLSGHTVVLPLIRLLPPEATSEGRPQYGLIKEVSSGGRSLIRGRTTVWPDKRGGLWWKESYKREDNSMA